MKLNNVLRLAAFVGTLVTAIFYLTKKVIYMYIFAVIVNFASLVMVLYYDSKILDERTQDEDYNEEEWTETNGKNP